MRSVIAAAVSLLCAKDDEEDQEEKSELTRSRDDNPESKFGQRLGDIANILLPKVIELLTLDQQERFSRHRIIRTPETKVGYPVRNAGPRSALTQRVRFLHVCRLSLHPYWPGSCGSTTIASRFSRHALFQRNSVTPL